MAYRRRNSGPSGKLLGGVLAIVVAVTAFGVYQALNAPSPTPNTPTVTLAVLPTVVAQTPEPTTRPVQFRLVSQKANIVAPIVNLYLDSTGNWDLTFLGRSVGYLQGTANPGQGGNYVLAGHVEMKDGSAGPFAYLNRLQKGDLINIISDAPKNPIIMEYAVQEVKVVDPNDFDEIRNHGHEELTLVTCSDWNQQSNTYVNRVVVHAQPVLPALNRAKPVS